MFYLFSLFLSVISANGIHYPTSLESYKNYTHHYNKSYSTQEFNYRFNIYKTNIDYINAKNNNSLFVLGINQFTDISQEEFKFKLNLKYDKHVRQQGTHIMDSKTVPSSIDWRSEGLVTNVKNQGQCGSCWAFSAIGAIEGQHAKNTSKLVSLSEQNLVDCAIDFGCDGCEGGWPEAAMRYVASNKGVDTELSYPYLATDEQCNYTNKTIGSSVKGTVNITSGNMTELHHAIGTVGPISVAIDAEDDFQFYKSGIYNSTNCSPESLDHAVLAIGYSFIANHTYIIVKNSWGADWGMDGYIYMSTDTDNLCGIAQVASYPIV
jgi:C1A family cysteine protease